MSLAFYCKVSSSDAVCILGRVEIPSPPCDNYAVVRVRFRSYSNKPPPSPLLTSPFVGAIETESNVVGVCCLDSAVDIRLHLAAWAGHANVVTALCKHKADVGAAAMDDMGAIHFAAQKGHLEVVKTLVSSGASLKAANRKGLTVLHYAVQGSHIELTKYLLKKGLNLNAKTKAGKTALELASNDEIRSLLVEHEKTKGTEVQGETEKVSEHVKEAESDSQLAGKAKDNEGQECNEEKPKRKGEGDVQVGPQPKPKKSKVALSHLLASDDTQDDEQQ